MLPVSISGTINISTFSEIELLIPICFELHCLIFQSQQQADHQAWCRSFFITPPFLGIIFFAMKEAETLKIQ